MTPDPDSRPAVDDSPALPRVFARPATFLLLIAGYFGWQVVVRLVTSGSAELDEAEQLFLTQQLAWGYGPQPPLYTWLQYPFIQLLGPSILPLALLKNLLLFGTFAFTYLSARRLTHSHLLAVAATVSLLFVPQISWESQRDLTHSVLVTLLAAATLYVFLRLAATKQLRFYVAFGLCVALGTLSKYSFLLFLAGLIAAALSLRTMRPVIWNPGMLLAIVVAAAGVTPHVLWAVGHQDAVLSAAGKFHLATGQPWLVTTFLGIKNLAGSVLVHIGALLGICFILCRKRLPVPPPTTVDRDYLRLLARSLVVIFALLMLAILCLRMTSFKDRWLLPIFICLPVGLAATLESRLNPARVRAMIIMGGVVVVAVSVLLPGRIRLAERFNKPDQQNAPFDVLTEQMRPFVPSNAVLVAESPWLGGNLRLFFPDHMIVTPRSTLRQSWREGQACLLVWDVTRNESPPEALANFAAMAVSDADRGHERVVEAPLKFFRTRTMRLGMIRGMLKDPTVRAPAAGSSPY